MPVKMLRNLNGARKHRNLKKVTLTLILKCKVITLPLIPKDEVTMQLLLPRTLLIYLL
jgi:hypothetical protein